MAPLLDRVYKKLTYLKQNLIKSYYRRTVARELKTEILPCLICGNNRDFTVLYERDRYGFEIPTVRCSSCSFVFERPAPTEAFLDLFYSSRMYRGLYRGVLGASISYIRENKSTRQALRNAEFLKKLSSATQISILDFGSSEGTFLTACKKQFPESKVFGVEPGSNFSHYHEKNLDGVYSSIKAIPPGLRFDYITLWHVLEHMKNPIQTLASLAQHVAPGGKIIIEVPNVEKYTDIKTIHIGHLYHWSPKTIELLAQKAGLRVEKITDELTNPGALGMKIILSTAEKKTVPTLS